MTMRRCVITIAIALVLAIAGGARADRPARLTVAIYAPSIELSTAGRVALVSDIAAAVQRATGVPTSGKAYSSYADLAAAHPDLAILDPLCIAAHDPGRVLAVAVTTGDTSRRFGVFAPTKVTVDALAGKRLAYVKTGCRDLDFIDNGVFSGLIRVADFFGGTLAEPDVNGAIVATAELQKAAAVLAPAGAAGSMELVLAVDPVPNPGLVVTNRGLDADLVEQVAGAVGTVGGGPIEGWRKGGSYGALAGRLTAGKKHLVLARPERMSLVEPGLTRPAPPPFAPTSTPLTMWTPPARRPFAALP
jgi:hypothetical protein